jgi:hypothetical protein
MTDTKYCPYERTVAGDIAALNEAGDVPEVRRSSRARVEQRGRGKDKIRIVVYPTHEPAKQKEEIGAA